MMMNAVLLLSLAFTAYGMNPKIMSSEGNLVLNASSESGSVLLNGVNALSTIAENTESIGSLGSAVMDQGSTLEEAESVIASLTGTVSSQASQFQEATSLITSQSTALSNQDSALGTAQGTIDVLAREVSTLTSSMNSRLAALESPSTPLTGTSASNADLSCAVIYQKRTAAGQSVPNGQYWIDTDGAGSRSPTRMTCDMLNGGFQTVNSVATVNVASRHAVTRRTYSVATFGYSTSQFRFAEVEANILFAGELDDTNNYLDTYFNNKYISRFKSSVCASSGRPVAGWPRIESVQASSFYLQTQPTGDVDQRCGSVGIHGRNFFYVTKIKVVPV